MDMRAIMEAAKPKIVETEKPKTRIKGVRAGNKLEVGARFGKTINGVHGTATIVEITKVQKREGQWDNVYYIAEWERDPTPEERAEMTARYFQQKKSQNPE